MNVRGKTGIINETGLPGAPAELLDCRSADFMENIEDGVRSTVQAVLAAGLWPVSSCQGHLESCPFCCVSLADEPEMLWGIQYAIHEINREGHFSFPVCYYLLPYRESCALYRDVLKAPGVIDISFGDFRQPETVQKQRAFEAYLAAGRLQPRQEALPQAWVLPYMRGSEHIDVYT